jgi:hypothetical protein
MEVLKAFAQQFADITALDFMVVIPEYIIDVQSPSGILQDLLTYESSHAIVVTGEKVVHNFLSLSSGILLSPTG